MKRFEESVEAVRAEFLSKPIVQSTENHSPYAVRAGHHWAQQELPSYMLDRIQASGDQSFYGQNGEDIFAWNKMLQNTVVADEAVLFNELKDIANEQSATTDEGRQLFTDLVVELAHPDRVAVQGYYESHSTGSKLGASSVRFLRQVPDEKLTETAANVRAAVYSQEGSSVEYKYNTWYDDRLEKIRLSTLRRNFTRAVISQCTGNDVRNRPVFLRRFTEGVDDKADKILQLLRPEYFNRNRQAYQVEMSYESITSNTEYAEEIIEVLESGAEALEAYYSTKFRSQELMTSGNHLFQTTLVRLSQSGSANAGKIVEVLRSQQKSSFLGVTRVANMLMSQAGNKVIDASGAETPVAPLDERSMYSIPTAFSRILHVCQDLGEASTSIDEESKENARLATEVASLLMLCGIDRKLEQPTLTVGDVVMRFPYASAQELSDIMDSLERGDSPDEPHVTYRNIRETFGSRVYWNRKTAGYGIMS